MEWGNFVSVVPAAKKSKLGPFSCQNILSMYIRYIGPEAKNGQKYPKKVLGWICCATFSDCPKMLHKKSGIVAQHFMAEI